MKLKVLEYIKMLKLGIVTYSFNPRNWKAEAGELAWNIDWDLVSKWSEKKRTM